MKRLPWMGLLLLVPFVAGREEVWPARMRAIMDTLAPNLSANLNGPGFAAALEVSKAMIAYGQPVKLRVLREADVLPRTYVHADNFDPTLHGAVYFVETIGVEPYLWRDDKLAIVAQGECDEGHLEYVRRLKQGVDLATIIVGPANLKPGEHVLVVSFFARSTVPTGKEQQDVWVCYAKSRDWEDEREIVQRQQEFKKQFGGLWKSKSPPAVSKPARRRSPR
jgi:hypothetical protein